MKKLLEPLRGRITTALGNSAPSALFSLETVLLLLSWVYGAVVRVRTRLYQSGVLPSKTLPCHVISVGNIVAGGTGKTPMTIFVAQRIRDLGYRVVVISRGYRGRMQASGGIVSDGRTILRGPEDAGDEPYLIARTLKNIPVVVGRRRYLAGLLAVDRFKPDVIVLDDAFQHMHLKRDLDLVLLDSRSPFGNGYLLPRGVLREPPSALRRAQVLILTRSKPSKAPPFSHALLERLPVYHTRHHPVIRKMATSTERIQTDTSDIAFLRDKKVVAFSGLAENRRFFDTLQGAGCRLMRTVAFADHQRYTAGDLDRIVSASNKTGADVVATTFKDYVKIQHFKNLPSALAVVDVDIELIGDEAGFIKTISTGLPPVAPVHRSYPG
ncbi:MAG: tetraacyldisaccharide 4'-kinase [Desulfosarcina sp.]